MDKTKNAKTYRIRKKERVVCVRKDVLLVVDTFAANNIINYS